MKRVLLLCVSLVSGLAGAEVVPLPSLPPLPVPSVNQVALKPLPHVPKGAFDLRFVNVGQVVDLVYGDALDVPHVIASDVLEDQRLVSFQFDSSKGDLRAFVRNFLDSEGFAVVTRDGVDYVSKKPLEQKNEVEHDTLVYHPRFRSAAYLSKVVGPLFSGHIAAAVPVAPLSASGVAAAVGASGAVATPVASVPAVQSGVSVADDLVFVGTPAEIRDVKRVLPELDRAAGEVVVRGWVYEVTTTNDRNSAFSIAAKVLNGVGGTLSLSNGPTDQDATALRFSSNYLNVAISALNADSRFNQVSDPHARVVSGSTVRLNVGSQVPTLGSISYQGTSGTPVQSVDYQAAGLIFEVSPVVMNDAIEVTLDEQISSFVATTTGVNNSPTKNTREMSTTVDMRDGEVVVIGGLKQDSDSSSSNSIGWLPKFMDGHAASKDRTEILLVLQVQKV